MGEALGATCQARAVAVFSWILEGCFDAGGRLVDFGCRVWASLDTSLVQELGKGAITLQLGLGLDNRTPRTE